MAQSIRAPRIKEPRYTEDCKRNSFAISSRYTKAQAKLLHTHPLKSRLTRLLVQNFLMLSEQEQHALLNNVRDNAGSEC